MPPRARAGGRRHAARLRHVQHRDGAAPRACTRNRSTRNARGATPVTGRSCPARLALPASDATRTARSTSGRAALRELPSLRQDALSWGALREGEGHNPVDVQLRVQERRVVRRDVLVARTAESGSGPPAGAARAVAARGRFRRSPASRPPSSSSEPCCSLLRGGRQEHGAVTRRALTRASRVCRRPAVRVGRAGEDQLRRRWRVDVPCGERVLPGRDDTRRKGPRLRRPEEVESGARPPRATRCCSIRRRSVGGAGLALPWHAVQPWSKSTSTMPSTWRFF